MKQAEQDLYQAIKDAGYNPRSYSGRSMCGKVCLGVDISDSIPYFVAKVMYAFTVLMHESHSPWHYSEDAVKMFRNCRADALEMGTIVYFPDVEWVDNFIEAYRFFRRMSGWFGHDADDDDDAMRLARAEIQAKELGIKVHWEYEDEPWDGEEPLPKDCELLCAIGYYQDEVMESLGMITVMPDREGNEYRRYIEAGMVLKIIDVLNDRNCKEGLRLNPAPNPIAEGW